MNHKVRLRIITTNDSDSVPAAALTDFIEFSRLPFQRSLFLSTLYTLKFGGGECSWVIGFGVTEIDLSSAFRSPVYPEMHLALFEIVTRKQSASYLGR